jgi:ferredoxin-NADP reductase
MDPTDATVVAVRDVGAHAVSIAIETPAGFDARPGQFVKLSLVIDGEPESRFYTISSPTVDDSFEVTLTYDSAADGEALGPRLAALDPGDAVTVVGPFGDAYYEDEPRTLVVAGGPGIGPAIGIAERTLADGGEAAVVYRTAGPSDAGEDGRAPIHEERLAALAAAGACVAVIDDDEALAAAIREVRDGEVQAFVYGFEGFLDAARDALAEGGADPATAKVESFGPAP